MEMRYIVIGLSLLAILGILGDLWLRRRKARAEPMVKKALQPLDPALSEPPVDDFPFAELPSGGARVRPVTPEEILALDTKFKFKTRVPILMDSVEDLPLPEEKVAPEVSFDTMQHSLDFNQELPDPEPEVTVDPIQHAPLDEGTDNGYFNERDAFDDWDESSEDDFAFSALSGDDNPVSDWDDGLSSNEAEPSTEADDASKEADVTPVIPEIGSGSQYRDRRRLSVMPAAPSVLDEPNSPLMDPDNFASPDDSDWEWDDPLGATATGPSNTADRLLALDDIGQPTLRQKAKKANQGKDASESVDVFASPPPGQDLVEPDEVIVINVVADTGLIFAGDQLLEIALACGMRFGAMDIFHRTDTSGRLQFSMASCTKPGTFDIDAISETTVSGVSLFMTLPCSSDAMQSFEYMSETANVLARHLKGVMKDESHNVMRGQTVEHCRNRIREYARAQMLNH